MATPDGTPTSGLPGVGPSGDGQSTDDHATSLRDRRVQYESAGLDVDDLDPDPTGQWQRWYRDALEGGIVEPNAMVVATIGTDGIPDARIVLARAVDAEGLVFYTNYLGAKSRELDAAPVASVVFSWLDLHRQVRARGRVERVASSDSDQYFASRPRSSQLGAWASPQSEAIADRGVLDARMARFDTQFADGVVPRPPHWGGWRLRPSEWEFWQGRPSRLHDRLHYSRVDNTWRITRLAP